MKILYCSYSQIPSSFANSIAVMKQCSALNHLSDLRVILIKGNKGEQDVFSQYGVDPFPLLLLPKWTLYFQELGLKIFVLIYVLLYRPDIVYSRDILLNEWLCSFHKKNIYEIHQFDQENNDFDSLYKKILLNVKDRKELQAVVCISKSLAKECEDFGIRVEKLAVLHSGVDLDECERTAETETQTIKISNTRPTAVYVGSLQNGKGVKLILQMSKIAPDINFLIVGGQPGQIEERENLSHVPRVLHKDALAYMAKADFLLLPMTEQRYKFHSPLKLFEYLAMGKIVIASDNADTREIITHMENGILADPSKPEDFVTSIRQICGQPILRKYIEENAKKTATQYTWQGRAEKIINLIRSKIYG